MIQAITLVIALIFIIAIVMLIYGLGTDNVKGGILGFIIGVLLIKFDLSLMSYYVNNDYADKLYKENKVIVDYGGKFSVDENNNKAYMYYTDSDGNLHRVYFNT